MTAPEFGAIFRGIASLEIAAMKRLALFFVLLLSLTACGPQLVSSDVTRFHSQMPPPGQSFTILPDADQRGSLEFQSYAEQVANALTAQGYRAIAPDGPIADMVVFLRYGVEPGRTEVRTSPVYGSAGYGWGPHSYGYGMGLGMPLGPDYETTTITKFARYLAIDIYDGPGFRAGGRQKLFEGRAISEGTSRDLVSVMPYLVRALFNNFPGPSGETIRVKVPVAGS